MANGATRTSMSDAILKGKSEEGIMDALADSNNVSIKVSGGDQSSVEDKNVNKK